MKSNTKDKNNLSLIQFLKLMAPYFLKRKKQGLILLIAILFSSALGRVIPQMIGYTIDEGFLKNNMKLVGYLAIGYFILEVTKTLFVIGRDYLFQVVGNSVLSELRCDLFDHVLRLPMNTLHQKSSGSLVTRLTNDINAVGQLFTNGLVHVFTSLLNICLIIFAMSYISIKLTLFTLLFSPLVVWASLILSKKIKERLRVTKSLTSKMNGFVAESAKGNKEITIYNESKNSVKHFEKLSTKFLNEQVKTVGYYALLWPTINLFNAIALITALYVGGYMTMENSLKIGLLVAFVMHIQDLMKPLRLILEKYQMFQNSITAAERVFSLLKESTEEIMPNELNDAENYSIEFKDVFFRYAQSERWILNNVNFKIESKTSVALVGQTGSGKTTIISLIQNFYSPNEGKILLNGQDLSSINYQSIRNKMGVILQDPFLFKGNLIDNITLYNPEITEERVRDSLIKAQCSHILDHPKGLYQEIEESGTNLSLGERQLLCFARIFAFDPKILILDEPTSNIDSLNEAKIQKATQDLINSRTSIIIAHRLSTVINCDQILVLDQGELKEFGDHFELIAKKGVYYEMYETQI